ncbi:MFS transporter [Brevibacterium ravenspurgense]|uniref:MFS transporter n=1 Tax=Brevibacterium ravenspurgense TaxID=479117 RepID=UPI001EF2E2F0|nr:MFS transporter [Brevibacterium ravenspurgense]MCG7300560.1 MFS transporter [Brevibacterium ravenspurgense]
MKPLNMEKAESAAGDTSGSGSVDTLSAPPIDKKKARKTLTAAVIGTTVEYYDFGIYGYMATMLGAHFFVADNAYAAQLGVFATFAVAFFLRLPGGIFFGHMGDKYGRKKALTWTIFLMVAATFLMGALPTYATLGLWATLTLVMVRCLQGFAAGGEISGANAFVVETAPRHKRATYTSPVNSGSYIGSLLAALVALGLNQTFDSQQILEWAWRLPFLISLPLGVVGLWIRNRLSDTNEFKRMQAEGEQAKVPLAELLRTSKAPIGKMILMGAQITGGYYVASVFAATFIQTTAGHSPTTAFTSTSIAMVLGSITLPLAGRAADKFGRKKVIFTGSISGLILGYPMFMLMLAPQWFMPVIAQSILFICVSIVNGASFTAYAEMLKSQVRFSGIALANNTSNMLLGGTAPFIATFLIQATGMSVAPAFYWIFCTILTIIGTSLIKETKGIELPT